MKHTSRGFPEHVKIVHKVGRSSKDPLSKTKENFSCSLHEKHRYSRVSPSNMRFKHDRRVPAYSSTVRFVNSILNKNLRYICSFASIYGTSPSDSNTIGEFQRTRARLLWLSRTRKDCVRLTPSRASSKFESEFSTVSPRASVKEKGRRRVVVDVQCRDSRFVLSSSIAGRFSIHFGR